MADFDENRREELLTDLERSGQLFPGYKLHRIDGRPVLLGYGGFSTIYEMRETNGSDRGADCPAETVGVEADCLAETVGADESGRAYAVKVIGMERHVVSAERFRDTCRLQGKLAEQSPYVMRLLDSREVETGEGFPLQLILMEKLTPVLEKDKFRNTKLLKEELQEESGVLQFALQIGQAIQTAHRNRVLHRDIKLENIFWNGKDQVYQLGDFGIARFVETGQAETVVYTDGYGAPEIERHLVDAYNATADIYSFGITLYLLLNGLKFPGSDRYRANAVQYDPEFVFPAPEKASPQLAGILRKMCSFYPEDRYQSMEEVLEALSRLVRECGEQGGQSVVEEELEDWATVTYREKTLRERTAGSGEAVDSKKAAVGGKSAGSGKGTRMKRIQRQKVLNDQYRRMEGGCTLLFALLFLLILYGLQKDMGSLIDWRFLLFPSAVLVEAILLKIKDFHVVFGIAAAAWGIYMMSVTGITVHHVILFIVLFSGIPAMAAAGAVAVFGWMAIRQAGGIALMDFLTKDWILWIYPVILLSRLHFWAWVQLVQERGENVGWRAVVWEVVYYWSPVVSVVVGIALWGAQKAGLLTVPEWVSVLHPVIAGVALFGVQCAEE